MKAFVLAAVAGKRLRPLTIDIPKPMIPVLEKPTLYYTFLNLKKNGFDSVCVNLYHHPDIITNFFKNNDTGVKLDFSVGKKLLGTAVAIKSKESFF
jgi:NDP-sugar pyrophosphorylase family protein